MRILALALLLDGPPTVEASPETVDVDAARAGVVVRAGERADDWIIEVGPPTNDRVVVTLTSPDGWVLRREVTLDGEDAEARARQLASSVVVVIENYEPRVTPNPDPPPPDPDPEPEPAPRLAGWLSVGGRVSTGPAGRAALAPGVALGGGTWLAQDHVVPFAAIDWRRSSAEGLVVDGLAARAGIAFGAAVADGHLWIGGGVSAGALGGFARDTRRGSGWAAHIVAPLLVQLRAGRLFAQLDAAPELALPPLRFVGNDANVRWGHLRAAFGLHVGIVLGGADRFGFRRSGSV